MHNMTTGIADLSGVNISQADNHGNFNNSTSSIDTTTMAMSSFIIAVILVTIIYNSLIIAAFLNDKRIRTPFNYYILNLTVADLGLAAVGMTFFVVENLSKPTPFSVQVCAVTLWSRSTTAAGAAYAVFLISLDRLWSVTWPLHYRQTRSIKVTGTVCLLTWLFINCWTAADILMQRLDFTGNDQVCTFEGGNWIFRLLAQIVLYDVPLVGVVVSYSWVLYKLVTRNRMTAPMKTETSQNKRDAEADERAVKLEKKEKKLFLALSWIAVMMILLWGPATIFFLLDSIIVGGIFDLQIFAIVLCLEYASCAINPFIYHSALPDIHNAVNELLCGRKEKPTVKVTSVSRAGASS